MFVLTNNKSIPAPVYVLIIYMIWLKTSYTLYTILLNLIHYKMNKT